MQGTEGQRYTLTRIFGRADHPWEGVGSYTNVGGNEHWRRFISGLNARERQYFRFPPPSDELYTADTLERLEEHYPGWNRLGEYSPVDAVRCHPQAPNCFAARFLSADCVQAKFRSAAERGVWAQGDEAFTTPRYAALPRPGPLPKL